jgi:hypothetical protein
MTVLDHGGCRLFRLIADRRASVAILTALYMSLGVTLAAIGIDVGMLYLEKRKIQSAADLAALAAAPAAAAAPFCQGSLVRLFSALEGVLDVAGGFADFSLGLVDPAFSLELVIAGELAGAFLYGAFGFLAGALDVFPIHNRGPFGGNV